MLDEHADPLDTEAKRGIQDFVAGNAVEEPPIRKGLSVMECRSSQTQNRLSAGFRRNRAAVQASANRWHGLALTTWRQASGCLTQAKKG
jgi:hypothetical protein